MEQVMILENPAKTNGKLQKCLDKVDLSYVNFSDVSLAVENLFHNNIKVVLIHKNCSGKNPVEVIKTLRQFVPTVQPIVIVEHISTQEIINVIKEGAFDLLTYPIDQEKLLGVIKNAGRVGRSVPHRQKAPFIVSEKDENEILIGKSAEMIEIYKLIGQIAKSNATVLIEGESGTGKELVAREIVRNSLRANDPFIAVNCAAIPETLLESELFGYEKGAFTDAQSRRIGKFEQCNGGTIFLDEIADMSPQTQSKVLRVIQNQSFERLGGNQTIMVDVRIIAASNKGLFQCAKNGLFRWDLYYRLKVVRIHLPRLRDRGEDVELLANHFLCRFSEEMGKKIIGFAPEALELLNSYHWAGNVRELENAVETAVVLVKGNIILPEHLPDNIRKQNQRLMNLDEMDEDVSSMFNEIFNVHFDNIYRRCYGSIHSLMVAALEKNLIEKTLDKTRGNQVKAAKVLGVSRNTLRERLERFDVVSE
jgi:DNA-binding NtrC family response regulator